MQPHMAKAALKSELARRGMMVADPLIWGARVRLRQPTGSALWELCVDDAPPGGESFEVDLDLAAAGGRLGIQFSRLQEGGLEIEAVD